MRLVVTGGAGFIGSHLTDALLKEGHEVLVIDDLSSGKMENVDKRAIFLKGDIRSDLAGHLKGADTVFHMAAEANVRASSDEPGRTFDLNVAGTFALLRSCLEAGVRHFVFASTSAVYGDADLIPTPESHRCAPISNYGASKASCESWISAFSHTYGMKGTSLRLANIIGPRALHGVIPDFRRKLMADPGRLEILGDGNQDKSYLHVSDCVSAMLTAWRGQELQYDVFNVGSGSKTKVSEIALMMCRELGVQPVISYTGSERGWPGDVKLMLLDTGKMRTLGWSEKTSLPEGIRSCLEWQG
ncbi:MAG: NAD-dependent epimerase/dehydratase family protein [Candidatus Micrarchaeota archaeon]